MGWDGMVLGVRMGWCGWRGDEGMGLVWCGRGYGFGGEKGEMGVWDGLGWDGVG